MEKELLIQILGLSDFITSEIKHQRGHSSHKDKENHMNCKCQENPNHSESDDLQSEMIENQKNCEHKEHKHRKHAHEEHEHDEHSSRKKHAHGDHSHNHSSYDGHHRGKGRRDKLSLTSIKTLLLLVEENNLNQRTLSKKLNVSAQAMSEIVKKLEISEFIEKNNNKINNENIISITEKGKEKAIHFEKLINAVSENIFSNFTIEEKQTFITLLNKIKREEDDL